MNPFLQGGNASDLNFTTRYLLLLQSWRWTNALMHASNVPMLQVHVVSSMIDGRSQMSTYRCELLSLRKGLFAKRRGERSRRRRVWQRTRTTCAGAAEAASQGEALSALVISPTREAEGLVKEGAASQVLCRCLSGSHSPGGRGLDRVNLTEI